MQVTYWLVTSMRRSKISAPYAPHAHGFLVASGDFAFGVTGSGTAAISYVCFSANQITYNLRFLAIQRSPVHWGAFAARQQQSAPEKGNSFTFR